MQESTQEHLNLIASKEFLKQHMERIDTLRVILKEMWLNYHIENNHSKKVQILEKIEENQIYLSFILGFNEICITTSSKQER